MDRLSVHYYQRKEDKEEEGSGAQKTKTWPARLGLAERSAISAEIVLK